MAALTRPLPKSLQRAATSKAAAKVRGASSRTSVSLQKADDLDLIHGAQAGDEESFRWLVERYKKRAYWLAYQQIHNEQDATDISQEAFIRVFKSIHRFDERYKFYTWLYRIVSNLCVDLLRKRGDRRKVSIEAIGDLSAKGAPVSQNLEHQELSGRVAEVLDRLPPKYKAVMVMRELKGIDAKEIARIVGSTHATIRWRLHRARALFRDAWEERFGGPPGTTAEEQA